MGFQKYKTLWPGKDIIDGHYCQIKLIQLETSGLEKDMEKQSHTSRLS